MRLGNHQNIHIFNAHTPFEFDQWLWRVEAIGPFAPMPASGILFLTELSQRLADIFTMYRRKYASLSTNLSGGPALQINNFSLVAMCANGFQHSQSLLFPQGPSHSHSRNLHI